MHLHGMGQHRQSPGLMNRVNRLCCSEAVLAGVGRLAFADVTGEGLVHGLDVSLLDHDLGDVGPAHDFACGHLGHLSVVDGDPEPIQILDDAWIALGPGFTQPLLQLQQARVIGLDSVAQDVQRAPGRVAAVQLRIG